MGIRLLQLLESCLTLCDPVDCSLQGSSVHGILQAGILEWVDLPSPELELVSPGYPAWQVDSLFH